MKFVRSRQLFVIEESRDRIDCLPSENTTKIVRGPEPVDQRAEPDYVGTRESGGAQTQESGNMPGLKGGSEKFRSDLEFVSRNAESGPQSRASVVLPTCARSSRKEYS